MTTVREALDQAKALLLDFDGPMARLMPPPVNAQVAERVRNASGVTLPPALIESTDHLAVLKALVDYPNALQAAEAAATRAEIECAQVCDVASWLEPLAIFVRERHIATAVVSNNSHEAVRTFLERHDVMLEIDAYACRTPMNVARLKPSPHLLHRALNCLGTPSCGALFIGDSVTDVRAGQALGVSTIGYAKNPSRANQLLTAGALTTIGIDEARSAVLPPP